MHKQEGIELKSKIKWQNRKRNQTVKSDTLEQIEAAWKKAHEAGEIDSPFDRDKFDFLAKLFAGNMMEQQKKD